MCSVEGSFMKRNKLTSFTESLGSSQDVFAVFLSWQNGFVSSTETRFSNTSWHWFLNWQSFLRGGFLICWGQLTQLSKSTKNKQAVCHTVALWFTLKMYLRAKEELWKPQIFHHAKIQSSKNPPKETKILQDIKLSN
jgi:hypothetical protein